MTSCSVILSKREVIEDKLLVALDGEDNVAIVCDRKLLSFLIYAARECRAGGGYEREYREQVVRDFRQLEEAAFGKKKS